MLYMTRCWANISNVHILKVLPGFDQEVAHPLPPLETGWGLLLHCSHCPPVMALTGQVPDLVLIDKSVTPTRVVLLELTVS